MLTIRQPSKSHRKDPLRIDLNDATALKKPQKRSVNDTTALKKPRKDLLMIRQPSKSHRKDLLMIRQPSKSHRQDLFRIDQRCQCTRDQTANVQCLNAVDQLNTGRPRSTLGLSPTIRSVADENQSGGPMKPFHWSAPPVCHRN